MWFKKSVEDDLYKIFWAWLPLAVLVFTLSGLTYVAAQQVLRQGANDPQIQLAEDVASNIANGQNPTAVFSGPGKLNIASSLAPFVIIYDAAGKPLAGNGQLGGTMPTPPAGVFRAALRLGESQVTWQPQRGVRIASVIKPYGGAQRGFVLAGRNLREVEAREQKLHLQVMFLCSFGLIASFAAVALSKKMA